MRISIDKEMTGEILDIGGGGEGIIGRVYGQQVTAIDNIQEELDEALSSCKKMLMDASELEFSDETFDHVTFFFSLMYMDKQTQRSALSEATRVLKKGGSIRIWDADIDSAYPDAFIAELDVDMPRERLHTVYGIIKPDASQRAETFVELCKGMGLLLDEKSLDTGWFCLSFVKPLGRTTAR